MELAQDLSAQAAPSTGARAEALWGTALSLEGADLAEAAEHLQKAAALLRAEKHFADGLALAEQLSIPERIAGLTANLGRVAVQRGQTALAVHRLSTALARAEALSARHLAAQIRLWLVPLLPPAEARASLAEARAIAESGGRRRLLEEVSRLEEQLGFR